MIRYHLSRTAEKDLDEIFVYLAERAGLTTADRILESISERLWLLGEYPAAGESCEDIAPDVRCFPAGKYLIYYRKTARAIQILHIFHGSRNQKKAWKARKKTP